MEKKLLKKVNNNNINLKLQQDIKNIKETINKTEIKETLIKNSKENTKYLSNNKSIEIENKIENLISEKKLKDFLLKQVFLQKVKKSDYSYLLPVIISIFTGDLEKNIDNKTLKDIYNLKELELSSENLNNINPLSQFNKLESVNLNNNTISNFEFNNINIVNSLKNLNLSNNNIQTIKLSQFINLTYINLGYNLLTSIPSNLPISVSQLILDGNKISKIQNIPNNITELNININFGWFGVFEAVIN